MLKVVLGTLTGFGALYLGQPAEVTKIQQFAPHEVSIQNQDTSGQVRLLIVRTSAGQGHGVLFSATLDSTGGNMFIQPDTLACDASLEASLDGKPFRVIAGTMCHEDESDLSVLIVPAKEAPFFVRNDPD
jgi:hypothetical protein